MRDGDSAGGQALRAEYQRHAHFLEFEVFELLWRDLERGEAHFTVAKNKEGPFIVNAGGGIDKDWPLLRTLEIGEATPGGPNYWGTSKLVEAVAARQVDAITFTGVLRCVVLASA